MKPNLDKLEDLPNDQLQKISTDIDTIGIRKAAAQAAKDTDRPIDKTCIQRFAERSIARHFLVESPDAAAAAMEILRFAVTGRPDFSDATIKVLDESAFKLSLVCTQTEEEMKALTQISTMLARYRGTAVRERMAKLQEDKLQLRREEFEWKKSTRGNAPVPGATHGVPPSGGAPLATHHSPLSDDLGPLALTPDDVERRAEAKFGNHATQSHGVPSSDGLLPPFPLVAAPRESAALMTPDPTPDNNGNPLSGVSVTDTDLASSPSALSSSSAVNDSSVLQCKIENDRCPMLNEENSGIGPSDDQPYLQPEKDSTPLINTDFQVGAPNPATAKTVLTVSQPPEQDPARTTSEPSHLPIPSQTTDQPVPPNEKNSTEPQPANNSSSSSAPSASSAVKQLPPVPNPCSSSLPSVVKPPSVPAPIRNHAIKRWRAHIPRPKDSPEPDGSWRKECPCGHTLPCARHPDAFSAVRCYKPQHPDYELTLKQFGIPYYVPTAEELSCTPEALVRSRNLFADNPRMKDPPHPIVDPFNQWLKR